VLTYVVFLNLAGFTDTSYCFHSGSFNGKSTTESQGPIRKYNKHFGFRKAILISTVGHYPEYNRDKSKAKPNKWNVDACKFIMAICHLLSGDIQQCPGPVKVMAGEGGSSTADHGSNNTLP